jgi:hypothetical protein
MRRADPRRARSARASAARSRGPVALPGVASVSDAAGVHLDARVVPSRHPPGGWSVREQAPCLRRKQILGEGTLPAGRRRLVSGGKDRADSHGPRVAVVWAGYALPTTTREDRNMSRAVLLTMCLIVTSAIAQFPVGRSGAHPPDAHEQLRTDTATPDAPSPPREAWGEVSLAAVDALGQAYPAEGGDSCSNVEMSGSAPSGAGVNADGECACPGSRCSSPRQCLCFPLCLTQCLCM